MKILFFGSDDFAAAHLRILLEHKSKVRACVTQPDKPKGRGMKAFVSPIKALAQEHGIPVLQPVDIKDTAFAYDLKNYKCDVFIVIAYGKILPQALLDIPSKGAVNVHASLLPLYRGAAPINWAVINGETETGVTVMKLNAQMDAGSILAQLKIAITPEDNAQLLRKRMMDLSPQFLLEALERFEKGELKEITQSSGVTFAPKLTKELGRISWRDPAVKIHDLVRGLIPWPAAFTHVKGKTLKVLETAPLLDDNKRAKPGEIVVLGKEGITVKTGQGLLLVKKVHLESAKPTSAHNFAIGFRLKAGDKFE